MAQLVKLQGPIAAMDKQKQKKYYKFQVSVKLTAFYSQLTLWMLRAVREQLASVYSAPQELGAVHFDMEQYAYKDLLSILKQLLMEDEFRDRTDVGILSLSARQ